MRNSLRPSGTCCSVTTCVFALRGKHEGSIVAGTRGTLTAMAVDPDFAQEIQETYADVLKSAANEAFADALSWNGYDSFDSDLEGRLKKLGYDIDAGYVVAICPPLDQIGGSTTISVNGDDRVDADPYWYKRLKIPDPASYKPTWPAWRGTRNLTWVDDAPPDDQWSMYEKLFDWFAANRYELVETIVRDPYLMELDRDEIADRMAELFDAQDLADVNLPPKGDYLMAMPDPCEVRAYVKRARRPKISARKERARKLNALKRRLL